MVAILLAAFVATAACDDYSGWDFHKDIELNTTASGAAVAGAVTSFPVLIRLTPSVFDGFENTLPGGADIRFSDTAGNPLVYNNWH